MLFPFLPTLSFITVRITAGWPFCFCPCASGLCAKPALSRASFRFVADAGWPSCFSPLIAPPSLLFFCVQSALLRGNSFQLLRVPPTCISQSRSPPLSVQKSLVLLRCILFLFLFLFLIFSVLTSSLFVCILISAFQLAALDFAFQLDRTCNHSFLADPSRISTPVPFACVVFQVPCLPNLRSRPLIYHKTLGSNIPHDIIYLASTTT